MGLDITAYRRIAKVENPELKNGELINWDTEFMVSYLEEWDRCFPGRAEGIENNSVYNWSDKFCFRVGSYHGYSSWRSQLANLAGFKDEDDFWKNAENSTVFYELINFYDNEGIIGPVVAAKLAKDFSAYREKAQQIGGYFFEKYCEWQQAFEMAQDNGAIIFH